MILNLAAALLLSAMSGLAAGAIYLLCPRRRTAEEWVLHRRAVSSAPVAEAIAPRSARGRKTILSGRWLSRLEPTLRADLGLLQLAHEPTLDASAFMGRVTALAAMGAAGGALSVLVMVAMTGLPPSPVALSLPVAGGLLLPAWSWLAIRRRASRVREGVERRLPRSLVAARVLLESGAATPEGALTHVVAVYRDPAADLVAEALRLKAVRRLPLEDALVEVSQRYRIACLARLADSLRVGTHHGTPMAELLAKQSAQLRHQWFTTYRERIYRAPVTMTIPALVFFVTPLLVLILFMVFAPLAAGLGSL